MSSTVSNNNIRSQRPEHVHYDYLEEYFIHCIQNASFFLFDRTEFDLELRRHAEQLNVPYEVRYIPVFVFLKSSSQDEMISI